MYEHPYLSHQVTRFEQEQLERAAERRRFLIEHADQIVPRPEGRIRRMLRRVLSREADAARPLESDAGNVRARSATVRVAERAATGCEPVGCEPAAAAAR